VLAHKWIVLHQGAIPNQENVKFCNRCGVLRSLRNSRVVTFIPYRAASEIGFKESSSAIVAEPNDLAADQIEPPCEKNANKSNVQKFEQLAHANAASFYK
jgi:hypothetical protein